MKLDDTDVFNRWSLVAIKFGCFAMIVIYVAKKILTELGLL